MPRFLAALAGFVAVVALASFVAAPFAADVIANRTAAATGEPSAEARALVQRLFVADLHADSLLWKRDPGRRHRRGHVDLPRMLEGNLALQAFTIVTKVPWGLNMERNESNAFDLITLLSVAQLWPPATWSSLVERAVYQASRLHDLDRERDDFLVIASREDLDRYLALRATRSDVAAGWLGVEGAHALEGKLENVDRLFEAGVRMMAPTHFFDTELSGSAHGAEKGGLTELGRAVIARMEELGMALDLAHASPRTIDEATAIATKPVIVSHTGVKGTCDNVRNLEDTHIREVAGTGGVIGIGFWEAAVCGTDAAAVARAIRYVTDLVGIDHAALGSDFDGAVETPFDAAGLAHVADALLAARYTDGEIAKIMGGNVARVLAATLPPSSSSAPPS